MSLEVRVDAAAAVPMYEQVRSQIAGAISGGTMSPGERLPAARALAADIGVAVNTVIRAYGELSREGLIHVRRRFGTVVAEHASQLAAPADVQAAANRLVLRAAAAGLTTEQVVDLIRATSAEIADAATTRG